MPPLDLLILLALGWSLRNRVRVGVALALILLVPGIATLWTTYQSLMAPVPPQPFLLAVTGTGALAINLSCAFLLTAFRHENGSLTRAAFLSARNDALANIAIIVAGIVTACAWHSAWPDLIVGLGICRNEHGRRARSGKPLGRNTPLRLEAIVGGYSKRAKAADA